MPFAVTHVLTSIITVDIYRDYFAKHKKYFTLHTLFIAGFAGLLPDIDIPLGYLLSFFGAELGHRTITHTPFFGLLFLIPGFYLWHKKKHKIAMYFFVTTVGVLLHVFLDVLFTPGHDHGTALLYPFSYAGFNFGILGSLSTMQAMQLSAALDSVLLLLWLWHEEIRHKISDFI